VLSSGLTAQNDGVSAPYVRIDDGRTIEDHCVVLQHEYHTLEAHFEFGRRNLSATPVSSFSAYMHAYGVMLDKESL
jgi:hypothetical protein